MRAMKLVGCLVTCVFGPGAALAQPLARLNVPQGRAIAGDQLTVSVVLDTQTACDETVYIEFNPTPSGRTLEIRGVAPKGQVNITFTGQIPFDQPGGDYSAKNGLLSPCPGYSYNQDFSFPPVALTVVPYSDQTKFPKSAKVELSLTQKQFLDTRAAELSELNSRLNTRLEQGHADLPEFRDFLVGIVNSADEDLYTTERQYRESILKSSESLPPLFADFHTQYHALLINLRAPIPGLAEKTPNGSLLLVQLKQRTQDERLAGTMPPAAIAVWQTIKDNIAAYKFIRDNGRVQFHAAFRSFPPDASIQYKKLIDDTFADYSKHTDIPDAEFDLATWMFKFHHPDCKDEPVLRIDPYQDTDPEISVEFMHCRGR